MRKYFANINFCLKLLYKSNKINLFYLFLFNLISVIIPFVNMFLSKYIIDTIVNILRGSSSFDKSTNTRIILRYFIFYFLCKLSLLIIDELKQKFSMMYVQNIENYINTSLMKKNVEIDISYFDNPDSYDNLNRSKDNAHELHNIIISALDIISTISILITSAIIAIHTNYLLTLLVIVFVIPRFLLQIKMEKQNYDFSKEQFRDIRKASYIYQLMFYRPTAKEIRFYGFGDYLSKYYLKKNKELVEAKISFTSKRSKKDLILTIPSEILNLFIQIYIVFNILLGKNSLGDFSFYCGIYDSLYSSIINMSMIFSSFMAYDEKINDFKKFFMMKESEIISGDIILNGIHSIEFKNVSFKYPHSNKYVLKNVSFVIKASEKVMIVGENGSGKSSLVKLLTRFYDPSEGTILINDINVQEYNINSVKQHISILFQDYNIYMFSIRENVALSNLSELNETKKIQMVLKSTQFNNSIYSKGDDIDLTLGNEFNEDGIQLSGGQKQKIGIARAFFKKADLIILDEPTSSLDPETEDDVLKNISEIASDGIHIIITHRLSYATMMSNIIVLKNGQIVGIGTHDELLHNEEYTSLYKIQAEKYN